MADFANLVLGVDTSGLKRGERALNDTTRAGGRTERAVKGTGRGFDKAGRSASTATPKVAAFGAATDRTRGMAVAATRAIALMGGAFLAVREISKASQAFANMSNNMRVLGFEAEEVVAQINAIGDIANRTRSPLEATAQLYQRISIAANDLGASQQEVLRFTENVGLALAQQGGSAAQASGALLQLSQAMSGGTVRAEEFNSILEGAFPIAQAAANAIEGAAGSVGQLRNMVIAGEVSSREFFDAILSSSDALEVAFGKTVPTVSQAITVLSTKFTLFIGQADNLLGVSGALAGIIIALANNLDLLAGVAVVGATAFGVRYVGAMIAARVATFSLTGALAGLKAALISTGIGALIVGAGVLLGFFSRLVTAAGGFGNALGLLKDVALGVWDKIKAGGEVLYYGLALTFNNINNTFVEMLGAMAQNWAKFSDSIAETNIGEMMGLEGGNVRATEIKYGAILNDIAEAHFELNGALGEAKGRLTATTAGMDELRAAMADANEETENGVDETAALAAELEGVVNAIDGSGGAAGALNNAEKAAIAAADAFDNKLSTAVDSLASAFGDFVASGFQDFKGMVDNILNSFKSMISQMIATAIANPIKLAMGIGGGGAAGAVASGLGGGGGILGSALGGLSALSGGIGSGVAVAVNGIMAGGGLGPAMGAISGGIGMGGAAGIGTAIGAVAVPLLAVAAAFSFFKKKTTELETGMRVTVEGMDTLVESYKKVQTSRFWGLSKKVADEFAVLDGATADPIRDVVRDLQQGVANAAASLGVGAEVFDGFSRSFTLNLKGLTDQEAQAALAAELQFTQDAFAAMIPTLTDFKVEGESTMGTLTRLISNITSANAVMSILGLRMFDLTLVGANAASVFNDAFGSLENLNAISSNYYAKAYTDVERVGAATGSMSIAMSELGVVMPKTIAGFRNLIEQADRMGDVDKVADLLILFGDFANIVQGQSAIDATALATAQENLATATTALKAAFSREMEATRDTFAAKIDALQESLTGAREKLANSRAIANALSDALDNRLFPSVEAQRQSQDAAAGYLASLVGSPINDADALQLALKTVADPSKDTYATLEDYRRDFNMTSGVIASLEKTAGFALSADEQAVILLEQQIADTQLQSDQAVDLLQQQLDGILGISDSMLSLADAIKGFAAASAVVAGAAGNTAGANTSGTSDTLADVMSAGLATEQAYLTNNPDVSAAVANGTFVSGYDHYQQYGNFEGRSYAGGGYTGKGSRTGGLDGQGGFMAMMHPQETVIDHTRGSANAKLEAQLDVLNARIEQLTAYQKQTTINTGNTSFDLKDIRRNGVQVEPVTGAIFKTDEVA